MMQGWYFDPNHGGCLRRVEKIAHGFRIHGVYGDDEMPLTHRPWSAVATKHPTKQHTYLVDFAGKHLLAHKRVYEARWDGKRRRLSWEDGNTWFHMFAHHSQLVSPLTRHPCR